MLLPWNCNLTLSGNILLETIGFLKINYTNSNDDEVYMVKSNLVTLAAMYTDPVVPIDAKQELFALYQPIVNGYWNKNLVTPGFSVKPLRDTDFNFVKAIDRGEEMCFEYKEKRD